MKLTVVIMVKNEIDVIRDCCGHLSALFDDIVIIDHRSTDGTKEYLIELEEQISKFHIYYFTEQGYYQSHLMTWSVKNIDVCVNADWVFLIDADEVLPFLSRAEFEQELETYSFSPIIKMPWKNLIPEEYSSATIMGRRYLESRPSAQYHKIAYQPSLLPVSDYMIAQGNHAVLAGGYEKELPSKVAFNILHVPIRSKSQLEFKIVQGTAAYSVMGKERNKALGTHWFDISNHIDDCGMSDDLLNGLAYSYGQPIDIKNINISKDKLLELGCRSIQLDYAYEQLPEVSQKTNDSEKNQRMLSDLQSSAGCELRDDEDVMLKLNSNREIVFMGNSNEQVFDALSVKESIDIAGNDVDFMIDFLLPASNKIESFTPTSWGGHIPFLFCLVGQLKPRVYAELGSHFGASFFAACQAMRHGNISGKAVAIDLWQGDEHAGFYGESVFKNFQYILKNKYTDVGSFLRMSFDDASNKFEDNSIDLLHIDGLHTYEAVKNDYELWRSKVTNNGVILFHDTNVFEREFGVWQLWKEISNDGESFEFKHTHGLGVIAFGSPDENPVVRLLALVNSSKSLSSYFESFFSRIGALTNEEALTAIRNGTSNDTSSITGSLRNKIRVYKQAARNKLVNFIKSVPILRSAAYSILRFVRR